MVGFSIFFSRALTDDEFLSLKGSGAISSYDLTRHSNQISCLNSYSYMPDNAFNSLPVPLVESIMPIEPSCLIAALEGLKTLFIAGASGYLLDGLIQNLKQPEPLGPLSLSP